MKNLVIARGEIGQSLTAVLEAGGLDVDNIARDVETENPVYDVLHICFPYSDEFKGWVRSYQRRFGKKDALVIVHSTTPMGVCDELGVVHSPVTGVHPNLQGGIRTFPKLFGGARAKEAAAIFEGIGIKTRVVERARETEARKIWDTTQYGWSIVLEKAIHAFCDKHGLDFDFVYTLANEDYNAGYEELGMGHFRRPALKHMDGPIGGHCVIPNCRLLGGEVADFILKVNDELCNLAQPVEKKDSSKMPSS